MVARAPRKRMYRTMQGRMVDIEKLRAANESVQAVGNMNVNARGDVLGPGGTVATPKAEVIQKYYEQPRGKVDDAPSKSKPATPPKAVKETPQPKMQQMTPTAPKVAKPKPQATPAPRKVTPEVAPKPQAETKTETKKSGIDAALDGLE